MAFIPEAESLDTQAFPTLGAKDFAVDSPRTSPRSSASLPIPIVGEPVAADARRPKLFRSASARHQPYPPSPASASGRAAGRSRSATSASASASDVSGWDSESSYATDFHGSSLDSCDTSPPTSCETSRPSTAEVSPYVVGARPRTGKDGKPTKSHTRKLDPGYIKRPPNAFILFRSHCCMPQPKGDDGAGSDPPGTAHARHLASLQLNNSQHVSVIVSQVWKGLAPEEKAYWEEKARLAKEEHRRLHPEYRYRPKQRVKDPRRRQQSDDASSQSQSSRKTSEEVERQVVQLEGVSLQEATDDSSAGESSRRSSRVANRKRTRSPPEPKSSRSLPEQQTPCLYRGDLTEALQLSSARDALSTSSSPFTPGSLDLPLGPSDPAATPIGWPHGLSASPDAGPFAFMNELNAYLGQPQPASDSRAYALDPSLACATISRPASAFSPVNQDDASPEALLSFPLTPPQTAPPPTYAVPSPPSRIGTPAQGEIEVDVPGLAPAAIQFNPASPFAPKAPLASSAAGMAPIAARRSAPLPSALLSAALQRRRSTLRASGSGASRGDLMLISPMVSTQDGRRQSLGFSTGMRRLSLAADRVAEDDELPTPRAAATFPLAPVATGVLSATETFETFSFPQSMLETLPAEDVGLYDLLTTLDSDSCGTYSPTGSDEPLRPSTAGSAWSDDGYERIGGDLPQGLLDRRRSTLIPIQFASPFASGSLSPAAEVPGASPLDHPYHVGAADYFVPPHAPVPSGIPCDAESPNATTSHAFAGYNSADLHGQSPSAPNPSALLPSLFSHAATPNFWADAPADVPVNATHIDEGWRPYQQEPYAPEWPSTGYQPAVPSHPQPHSYSAPAETPDDEPSPTECQYVYLTLEQLQDTDLMSRIHE